MRAEPSSQWTQDWAAYWKIDLQKEAVRRNLRVKEIIIQNAIHETWASEQKYVDGLDVMMTLFNEDLIDHPAMMENGKRFPFVETIFAKVDMIRTVNQRLLRSLKARVQEQGPWVVGIWDILREWIPHAKSIYLDYAGYYPVAEFLIQKEAERNIQFKRAFDPEFAKLDWLKYLRSPAIRIHEYLPLLQPISENSISSLVTNEMQSLASSFENTLHDKEQMGIRIEEIACKLVLGPGMKVELNLDDECRELLLEGDLQLRRVTYGEENGITIHTILFDNYLILTNAVKSPSGKAVQDISYNISRMVRSPNDAFNLLANVPSPFH